ncbi:Uncharacterised protein [Lactiplantibacillus plantarum]|nr:Uncharacterised protein [Lactiplantibacillus plantarum]
MLDFLIHKVRYQIVQTTVGKKYEHLFHSVDWKISMRSSFEYEDINLDSPF